MADPDPAVPAAAPPTETSKSNTWGYILTFVAGAYAKDVMKEVLNKNFNGVWDKAVQGGARAVTAVGTAGARAVAATGAALVTPEAAAVAGVTTVGAAVTVPVALSASEVAMARMNAAANVAIRKELAAKGVTNLNPTGYTPFLGRPFSIPLSVK